MAKDLEILAFIANVHTSNHIYNLCRWNLTLSKLSDKVLKRKWMNEDGNHDLHAKT